MMLNTDMCLAFTNDQDGNQELRAGDGDCCAWRFASSGGGGSQFYSGGMHRGVNNPNTDGSDGSEDEQKRRCENGQVGDCGDKQNLRGPAWGAFKAFALNEDVWFCELYNAWRISTSNGHSNLKSLAGSTGPSACTGFTGDRAADVGDGAVCSATATGLLVLMVALVA
eukprot:TRINITY_DN64752_c0_g1_i1.p1 TRINITY_DN64752_c0_g1~~TRINITY_DN64752_c0_g1_i1.p1  ORF type:complete len:168 (+),score=27.41 TRINITY_DN64752_c0_g1_i1:151-654(+)